MTLSRPWTLAVPVISTAHCPDNGILHALAFVRERSVALYDEGAFVFLGHPDEDIYTPCEQWLVPIANWLHDLQGVDCSCWVRFDSSGDVVAELPTFDWE